MQLDFLRVCYGTDNFRESRVLISSHEAPALRHRQGRMIPPRYGERFFFWGKLLSRAPQPIFQRETFIRPPQKFVFGEKNLCIPEGDT